MKLFITIILLTLISWSCKNYQFIVRRENIIYDQTGYMCINGKRAFFVESKDSMLTLNNILKEINKNTFWLPLLPRDELHAFKMTASVDTVINLYNDKLSPGVKDSLYYIFIRLRGYPEISPKSEGRNSKYEVNSYFKLNNNIYQIPNITFNQNIVYYYPVRYSEIQQYIINIKTVQNQF